MNQIDASHLPLFVAACVAVLLSPSPNVLYAIACSVKQGRQAGLVSVSGVEAGTLLQVAAASLGISALVQSSAWAFDAIKYVGAACLGSTSAFASHWRAARRPRAPGTHRPVCAAGFGRGCW
jgi:threonine/homoserine/homoserine lactone efflux protein